MFKRAFKYIDVSIFAAITVANIEMANEVKDGFSPDIMKELGEQNVKHLSQTEESQIKSYLNLDQDARIMYSDSIDGVCAGKTIVFNKNMYNKDKDATMFILRHEKSHLDNKDFLTIFIYPTVLMVGTFCLAKYMKKPALVKSIGVYAGSTFCIGNHYEKRADASAIENSTIEELYGGRRYMIAQYNYMMHAKKSSLYYSIMITDKGALYTDVHPSYMSRLNKIEKELTKRGIADVINHPLAKPVMIISDRDAAYILTFY